MIQQMTRELAEGKHAHYSHSVGLNHQGSHKISRTRNFVGTLMVQSNGMRIVGMLAFCKFPSHLLNHINELNRSSAACLLEMPIVILHGSLVAPCVACK